MINLRILSLELSSKKGVSSFNSFIWAVLCKNVSSGIYGQQRPRSACASAQSDQGLCCELTELLDDTECMNEEQRPG